MRVTLSVRGPKGRSNLVASTLPGVGHPCTSTAARD